MESVEKPTLIIRADANAKIGSGHVMRMFALAQSWKLKDGKVIFITNCESAALIEKLKAEDFEVIEVENSYPHPADWKITKQVLDKFENSWCVVDGYDFDNGYYDLIRQNGNKVLAVDDTVRLPFYKVDAILNQNINAEKLNYECTDKTQLLLGTKYTMLRQEFLKQKDWQRETPEIAQRILVTMGGSDIHNQTLKVIRAIEKLEFENLQIRAVVGSSNPNIKELEKEVKKSSVHIELIRNAENMSELMIWANLAISAAGSTCWELCFMKVPSVLIVTAGNQIGIGEGLGEAGFAKSLGWFEQVSVVDLTETLDDLLSNKSRREEMSKVGHKIIDGKGTDRIIDILLS